MTRTLFLSLLLACAAAAPSLAQAGPAATELDSLTRVRVSQTEVEPRRFAGGLLAADSLSITVDPERGGERLEVPLSSLRRLEVSLGRRTPGEGMRRGAARGLLVGLGASALLIGSAAIADEQEGPSDGFITATAAAVIISIPLTAATTVTGALWGATSPGERWRRVETPVRIRP